MHSSPLSCLGLFNGNLTQTLSEPVSNYITKQMSMDPTDVVLLHNFQVSFHWCRLSQPPLDGSERLELLIGRQAQLMKEILQACY